MSDWLNLQSEEKLIARGEPSLSGILRDAALGTVVAGLLHGMLGALFSDFNPMKSLIFAGAFFVIFGLGNVLLRGKRGWAVTDRRLVLQRGGEMPLSDIEAVNVQGRQVRVTAQRGKRRVMLKLEPDDPQDLAGQMEELRHG
ncbi:MAG: hypothetical protein CR993_05455 [Rhodobacterales bacterium]|nr:MAG: hypothetical protein CR993_05455 [Rhodobacterales bacterium]